MQTNNAHEYTDEQIQSAIDAAFMQSTDSPLYAGPSGTLHYRQAPSRLAIARAFLAALPAQPGHCVEADQKADPYARLKAYNEAGARIRFGEDWKVKAYWSWVCKPEAYEVHPDDLHMVPEYAPKAAEASAETEQAKADDGLPWQPHDGGPCPLKDEEVEEWEWKLRPGYVSGVQKAIILLPSELVWDHNNSSCDIIAYRVIKWKPGHGPQAASKADEPAPAKSGHGWPMDDLLKSMDRPTASQPWTPKPGDVVRLKSGGPEMTVCCLTPEGATGCAWFDDGWCLDTKAFPAACLTPAKEGQP